MNPLKKLIREAKGRGWTVTFTNKNHLKWTHRNGSIVFSSGTPGDHRAVQNIRSDLRRHSRKQPTTRCPTILP